MTSPRTAFSTQRPLKQERFAHEQGLRLGRFFIFQMQLNQEPAQIRSEYGVSGMFFGGEHLFDGTHVAAPKHL
jgi:hypothetical protein